jgi:hypothetical protein
VTQSSFESDYIYPDKFPQDKRIVVLWHDNPFHNSAPIHYGWYLVSKTLHDTALILRTMPKTIVWVIGIYYSCVVTGHKEWRFIRLILPFCIYLWQTLLDLAYNFPRLSNGPRKRTR